MSNSLVELQKEYTDLSLRMSDAQIFSSPDYIHISKRHTEIGHKIELLEGIENLKSQILESEDLLKDPELKEMAEEELTQLKAKLETQQSIWIDLITPKENFA
ncbi:MAG: PCRF domain-containing protein, partial [Candidatus Paceibacterota bacterium]